MQNNTSAHKPSCWVVTEGLKGTENQCLGVAKALEIEPLVKQISLRQPWHSLSPPLLYTHRCAFMPPLEAPWPDILIASGRKSILASLYIKKKSRGDCLTVQLQDPRISPDYFDIVAVPAHDPLRAQNVIVTDGAPNQVTPELLKSAREKFTPVFGNLPEMRIGVLIGGGSKVYEMTEQDTEHLVHQLLKMQEKYDVSLMITASRRTGEKNVNYLREKLKGKDIYFWNEQGENPYLGILAWADILIVSEDSVSMISEAASTGKPVYKISLTGGGRRITKFHEHLKSKGILRNFQGDLEKWSYTPLQDSQKVARKIKEKLNTKTTNYQKASLLSEA